MLQGLEEKKNSDKGILRGRKTCLYISICDTTKNNSLCKIKLLELVSFGILFSRVLQSFTEIHLENGNIHEILSMISIEILHFSLFLTTEYCFSLFTVIGRYG